jgi:hypothetical protein
MTRKAVKRSDVFSHVPLDEYRKYKNLEKFVKAVEYLEITHQMLVDSGCELEVLDEIEALLEKFK